MVFCQRDSRQDVLEQAIETITVFGQSGVLAPGGVMNVYVGGVIGFAWAVGVVRWAMKHMNSADETTVEAMD